MLHTKWYLNSNNIQHSSLLLVWIYYILFIGDLIYVKIQIQSCSKWGKTSCDNWAWLEINQWLIKNLHPVHSNNQNLRVYILSLKLRRLQVRFFIEYVGRYNTNWWNDVDPHVRKHECSISQGQCDNPTYTSGDDGKCSIKLEHTLSCRLHED